MRLLIPLFSPATGTWGGLTRVLAIAQAAQAAGHQVAFSAAGGLADDLRRRGHQVFPTPATTMLGLPKSLSRVLERRSQSVTLPVRPGRSFGNWWFVLVLSGLARSRYLLELVEAEKQAAEAFQADMLFTDVDPGAYLLGAVSGLPMAATYQNVLRHGIGSLAWRWVRAAFAPVLRFYGQPALTPDELWFSPRVLKLIPSIPELDGADPARPDVCYVGHLLGDLRPDSDDAFQPEPERRYVFVYVGTGALPQPALRRVLPQVFPANGPYSVLVGAQSVSRPERLGAVEFRPYVPAESILPHCDWVICHGGQNTIIQALRRGVPLIVFPGPIFERRFNAQKVQEAGAGVMGELNQFTAEWLSAVLERQAAYGQGARVLRERILSYGGAQAAVAAMERWQALYGKRRELTCVRIH